MEAREAAAVELEATLKQQQAQSQQAAEGMHALEDRESKIAAREAEFERFRAKRTKALDAREAEVADLEIMMKTFNAQNKYLRECQEGMIDREMEFQKECVERTRALLEREEAMAELEEKLKQQASQEPPFPPKLAQPSPGAGDMDGQEDITTREAKFALEAVLKQQEAQGQKALDDLKALEDREAKLLEKEAALEAREATAAADAKVHSCFYEELEEQKQLLAERDQAALEQAAVLEKRELEFEEAKSKLQIQEQSLRRREALCTEREAWQCVASCSFIFSSFSHLFHWCLVHLGESTGDTWVWVKTLYTKMAGEWMFIHPNIYIIYLYIHTYIYQNML